jgi:hypothetical protein
MSLGKSRIAEIDLWYNEKEMFAVDIRKEEVRNNSLGQRLVNGL